MRRVVLILLALGMVLVAGCGGDSASKPDPLHEALSFVPRDALFAAIIDTDAGSDEVKGALDLVRRFPGGTIALGRVEDAISQDGLSYQDDVRPVLGNPIAVAAAGPDNHDAILAGVAKDSAALDRLLARARAGGFRPRGAHGGFSVLVDAQGAALARDGDTVVAASDLPALDAAIDRHARGRGIDPDALEKLRGDLPSQALVTGYGSISRLLAQPGAQRSQSVPWLAALKGYAFTIRGSEAGLTFDGRLDTSDGHVTPGDLPIAAGPDLPDVVTLPGHATLGLRDPAQTLRFLLGTYTKLAPGPAARFRAAEARIRAATGVDLERLLVAGMTEDATLSVDPLSGQVLLRAGLRNPIATHAALTRIGDLVPALLAGAGLHGTSVNPVGAGLWVVHKGGHAVGSYGVTAGQLVAGNVPPAALAVLARRPTAADPDGGGALSARVPRAIVASLAGDLGGIPEELRGLVLGRLGDLHGVALGLDAGDPDVVPAGREVAARRPPPARRGAPRRRVSFARPASVLLRRATRSWWRLWSQSRHDLREGVQG